MNKNLLSDWEYPKITQYKLGISPLCSTTCPCPLTEIIIWKLYRVRYYLFYFSSFCAVCNEEPIPRLECEGVFILECHGLHLSVVDFCLKNILLSSTYLICRLSLLLLSGESKQISKNVKQFGCLFVCNDKLKKILNQFKKIFHFLTAILSASNRYIKFLKNPHDNKLNSRCKKNCL